MIRKADFWLEGSGPHGVLLIHGLTGTPNEMRILAKALHRRGYTVHGVQLAGHGGDMEDLIATGWRDWYASVDAAAERMASRVDKLFVGGLSMGALLALKLASEWRERIAGVGVYGVTFRYDGWSMPRTSRLACLLPMFKRLGIGRSRVFMEQPPYGIRDEQLRGRIVAAMQGEDSTAAGLPGNPWHALAEMYKLSTHVRRRLHRVISPCLVAHAREDDVASLRNAERVLRGVRAPTDFLVLDDSYHMITIDRQRSLLAERSAAFFDAISGETRAPLAA
ncbi:alpha/beta hydrolase [Aerosticca soli]|uniref:Alpha/beta hydrolase fold n=1 Tax=Aerosticca soli TaxID=2010829 RepID=A0A2Z6E545_9GAMM|nr:alpha/beta fold hydrolase [Aerosticca soli]MDI3262323.1 alpha/beta fold hydrolase [Fulvimonas sp.]BBD80220.1 alpha/beta hydrolase fold [Aerosticca soli]